MRDTGGGSASPATHGVAATPGKARVKTNAAEEHSTLAQRYVLMDLREGGGGSEGGWKCGKSPKSNLLKCCDKWGFMREF